MGGRVIVVGGGSCGCVLGSRLSEDPECRVVLLEAGPDYPGGLDELPPRLAREEVGIPDPEDLWTYPAEVVAGDDRLIDVIRGRVIGGSGAVNGSLFWRGLPEDYDGWSSSLWTDAVLGPYFDRLEHDLDRPPAAGSCPGAVPVRRLPRSALPPTQQAFESAARAAGHPESGDVYGEGIGSASRNSRDDLRMSAALTHLQAARERRNLEVLGGTRALRIRFEGRRAVGVEVADATGARRRIDGDEVILCAGAIESPHLLLLSGIGPEEQLQRHGIEVVADLPGVGRNLRDHPSVHLEVDASSVDGEDPRHHLVLVYTAAGSSTRSDVHVLMGALRLPDDDGGPRTGFAVTAILEAAESVGEIALRSADPFEAPAIRLNYLESERDRRRLREAVRASARLLAHSSFAALDVTRIGPRDDELEDDLSLDRWIREHLGTAFHTCGTCKMGMSGDRSAVVDERGAVHGVAGLRVADLSIAPDVPRAPTNATAMVIGERIADLQGNGAAASPAGSGGRTSVSDPAGGR